jgi:hypothetical protein
MADEVYFTRPDAKRISQAVRYAELTRRGKTGPGKTGRGRGPEDIWVVFQEAMHHKKNVKTKAFLWIPDENNQQGKPEGQNVDDGMELEIFPGPIAKGIWLPGDVCIVRSIDISGLAPISHGRQYFEGTLQAALPANGTANVSAFGQLIEVKEGGFAASAIANGSKVGCSLAHGTTATNAEYIWRAIVARC